MTKHQQQREGLMKGGRPRNDSRYPDGMVFDAETFRFSLTRQRVSLRDMMRRLHEEEGIRVHRSTAWRWTQFNLYPGGSTPPLHALRALERMLGVALLKDGEL